MNYWSITLIELSKDNYFWFKYKSQTGGNTTQPNPGAENGAGSTTAQPDGAQGTNAQPSRDPGSTSQPSSEAGSTSQSGNTAGGPTSNGDGSGGTGSVDSADSEHRPPEEYWIITGSVGVPCWSFPLVQILERHLFLPPASEVAGR